MSTGYNRIVLVFAAFCLPISAARAQNVANGKAIAEVWCSNCHRINPEQRLTASDTAPPFSSIARMRSANPSSLTALLSTKHGGMPDLTLSRQEIRDLSAYILSLHRNR
jgi:mono/diheme cytochrome c family protein